MLILALILAVIELLRRYAGPSLSLLPSRIAASITLALASVSIILLIRHHLRTRALPPGTPTATRLTQPHLIAVLLTGASLLLATISVAALAASTVAVLGLVGLAGNVGRYPGQMLQNNRMLAWTVGGLLLLMAVEVIMLRGSG